MYRLPLAFLVSLLLLVNCKKENIDDTPKEEFPDPDTTQITTCNDTLLPIIAAHGFLASGDTYAKHFLRFTSNNYCAHRLFAYDWNSIGGGNSPVLLDAFIDEVLATTGASKVNLMGHSAGGGLGYNYLSDAARAAKVAHYVHIGSGVQSGPAGPNGEIPTLNIWSDGDEVVAGGDIPGATNVMIPANDHYQVATSTASFEAIYAFLNNGEQPQTTNITSENIPCIAGKALTFGENNPAVGATIQIYEVDAQTAERLSASPDVTFTADAKGNWGPHPVKPNAFYELVVTTTTANDRVVHYYREPFTRTNNWVYLRTLPPPGSLAGLLLSALPKNDNQVVMAVFSSSSAVIDNRDELIVDGFTLSTNQYTPSSKSAIAFFLYDSNNDGQTNGSVISTFASFPFLVGVDLFFPTTPPGTITLQFNDRTLNVRNWRSNSDGVVVPVFD